MDFLPCGRQKIHSKGCGVEDFDLINLAQGLALGWGPSWAMGSLGPLVSHYTKESRPLNIL